MQQRPAVTCPICGCGCGIYIVDCGDRHTRALGMRNHSTSAGRLCARGWQVGDLVTSARQLTQPLVRREGQLVPCSYQDALAAAADLLAQARSANTDTWLLGAAHLTNEDAFAAARFATDVMATPFRNCPARAGDDAAICQLQQILRTPYLHPPLASLTERDVILVLHSNLDTQHPQANAWTLEAQRDGAKIIVLDEVCGDLARVADLYVRLAPGGLQDVLTTLVRGARDANDVSDEGAPGEALELLLGARRPAIVASAAALPTPSVAALAGTLATLLVGDDASDAIFLMRSEVNSLGTAVMGLTPEGDAETSLHQLLDEDRSLGATVIVDEDLTQFVGPDGLAGLRPKLGGLIVLSAFPSPTVDLADVVLPMATIGQREGTVTSGAGRVWLMDALTDPPGEARSAVQTLADLAARLGGSVAGPELAEVWQQARAHIPACADVDLDDLRAGHEVLVRRDELALRLPLRDDLPGEAGGEESGEADDSFVLIVRRDQNDRAFDPRIPSMALLERDMLRARVPYIWLSRDEMVERRIRPGQCVRITTSFGSAEAPAQSLDGAPDGLIVLPHHFSDLRRTLAGPGEAEACGSRSWGAVRAELTAS